MIFFLLLVVKIYSQPANAARHANPAFSNSVLVKDMKISGKMSNALTYSPLVTPNGAVFCRMENAISKKYKLNVRLLTGGF